MPSASAPRPRARISLAERQTEQVLVRRADPDGQLVRRSSSLCSSRARTPHRMAIVPRLAVVVALEPRQVGEQRSQVLVSACHGLGQRLRDDLARGLPAPRSAGGTGSSASTLWSTAGKSGAANGLRPDSM